MRGRGTCRYGDSWGQISSRTGVRRSRSRVDDPETRSRQPGPQGTEQRHLRPRTGVRGAVGHEPVGGAIVDEPLGDQLSARRPGVAPIAGIAPFDLHREEPGRRPRTL